MTDKPNRTETMTRLLHLQKEAESLEYIIDKLKQFDKIAEKNLNHTPDKYSFEAKLTYNGLKAIKVINLSPQLMQSLVSALLKEKETSLELNRVKSKALCIHLISIKLPDENKEKNEA